MTTTTSNAGVSNPAPIDAEALDALINNALGDHELEDASESAFHIVIDIMSKDNHEVYARVRQNSSYNLALEMARRVINAPLADHREEFRALLQAAVDHEVEQLALEAQK